MSRLWLQTADGALRADQVAELRTENQALERATPGRHTADENYSWALVARHVTHWHGVAPEVVVAAGDGYVGGAAATQVARILARYAGAAGLVTVRTEERRPGVQIFVGAEFEPWHDDPQHDPQAPPSHREAVID